MIKINLLPYKKKKASALRVNVVAFVLFLITGNIIFWGLFLFNEREIASYEREIA